MDSPISFAEELLIAAAMMSVTVVFHATVISAAATLFRSTEKRLWGPVRFLRDSALLSMTSLIVLAAHCAEIWAWAAALLALGAFSGLEESLYFSSVAFTTLGFGDVLLPQEWRLLAGAIAADGFILFGMSAAFLFEAVRKARIGDAS